MWYGKEFIELAIVFVYSDILYSLHFFWLVFFLKYIVFLSLRVRGPLLRKSGKCYILYSILRNGQFLVFVEFLLWLLAGGWGGAETDTRMFVTKHVVVPYMTFLLPMTSTILHCSEVVWLSHTGANNLEDTQIWI